MHWRAWEKYHENSAMSKWLSMFARTTPSFELQILGLVHYEEASSNKTMSEVSRLKST